MPVGRIITDPNIIAQLRASAPTEPAVAPSAKPTEKATKMMGKVITDPNQIAQLNQMAHPDAPSAPTDWKGDLLGALSHARDTLDKSADYAAQTLTGPLEAFKDVGNVVNKVVGVPQMTFDPESVVKNITGHSAKDLKYGQGIKDISEAVTGGLVAPELEEAKIAQFAKGASGLPEAVMRQVLARGAGQVAPQAAMGAALTPQDRMQGAIAGGAGGLANSVLGSILHLNDAVAEKFYPKKLTQQVSQSAKNLYGKLMGTAKEGYDLIGKNADAPVVRPPEEAEQLFGKIYDPSVQEEFFQQDKNRLLHNIPELKDALAEQAPSTAHQINQVLDPLELDYMEKKLTTPGSDLRQSYKNFMTHPTIQNADDFKKDLAARSFKEGKAGNSGNKQLLDSIRKNLTQKLIAPALDASENEVKNAGEKYLFSDNAYRSLKRIFDTDDIDKIGRGRVLELTPQRVKKALGKAYEEGNLEEAPQLESLYKQFLTKKMGPIESNIAKFLNERGHGAVAGLLSESRLPQVLAHYANITHPYGLKD